jgi:hypothetical protein
MENNQVRTNVAILPPTTAKKPGSSPEADAHNKSIIAIRGLSTTATGEELYGLAYRALQNWEIFIDSSSQSTDDISSSASDIGEAKTAADGVHKDRHDADSSYEHTSQSAVGAVDFASEIGMIAFEPFYFFFYGSLQITSVLRDVCDPSSRFTSGRRDSPGEGIDEFAIYISGRIKSWKIKMWGPFPALVPADDDEYVAGVVWHCRRPELVSRLCLYETNAYRLAYCDVEVPLIEGGGYKIVKNARTFVSTRDPAELEDGQFDIAAYLKTSMFVP